jgi:glyceraldehyde 3-phosphate dehydrogenase
MYNIY